MSAKSRKRNKRLLALAGLIGVGMAAKNKRNASIDKGIKSAEDDKGSDMAPVVPKKKPDSKMPDNLSKDMGKNNKTPYSMEGKFGTVTKTDDSGKKTTTKIKPFKSLSLGTSSNDSKPAQPGKTMAESNQVPTKRPGDTYYSDGSKRLGAINRSTSTTKPGMKSGGRAEYKSGGKVKGCGKALRGFGKAMKGSR